MKFFSIAAAIAAFAAVSEAVLVNPLPKPREMTWQNDGPIALSNSFEIVSSTRDNVLCAAMSRTKKTIFQERYVPQAPEKQPVAYPAFPGVDGPFTTKRSLREISKLEVKVNNTHVDLQHGVDESYSLSVQAGAATLTADNIWGALHGLSTFEQIVIANPKGNGLIIEDSVAIKDAPMYPHRGVIIDTGRNFYDVKSLLRQIDAMALAKLNVLHWHIVDTQSWPIHINKYPQMTKDAYSAKESYSRADVKNIINYAWSRGVRVIPEIDMPAHANSGWRQIDPKIVACGTSWWDNDDWTWHTAVEPNPGQLDITYPGTYTAIKNVYDELADVFPEKLWHGGWDEPNTYCYNYSSSAAKWFKDDPKRTYVDLYNTFVEKAHPILSSKKNRVIYWEDVILGSPAVDAKYLPPKTAIMQTWNNGPLNTKKLTSMGYDVVVSSADFYYLDCGYGGWVGNDPRTDQDYNNGAVIGGVAISVWGTPNAGGYNYGGTGGSWCAPYKSWQRIHQYDITYNLTAAEKKHVLGGEVALWSEQSDSTVVDNKLWPRAAAFAESMWSGNRDASGKKDYNFLTQRILEFRERLVGRGLNAAPLQPKYCAKNPHACDLYRTYPNGTSFTPSFT